MRNGKSFILFIILFFPISGLLLFFADQTATRLIVVFSVSADVQQSFHLVMTLIGDVVVVIFAWLLIRKVFTLPKINYSDEDKSAVRMTIIPIMPNEGSVINGFNIDDPKKDSRTKK